MRVLVIDDDGCLCEAVRSCLELTAGWEVRSARDGEEGVERAARLRPDVVLLDVTMPEMDGVCTLRELQLLPETRDLPVIFLTASVAAAEARRGGASVKGIIAKPFDPMRLADEVRRLLAGG